MAALNKFSVFVQDLARGNHNFATSGNTFKLALATAAPVATNTVFSNITELAAGNGYTAGGNTLTISSEGHTAGLEKIVISSSTFTASGGSMGPFRYCVVYNFTTASPVKPLVGWADYGSDLTLGNGEPFTVTFDTTNGAITIQ